MTPNRTTFNNVSIPWIFVGVTFMLSFNFKVTSIDFYSKYVKKHAYKCNLSFKSTSLILKRIHQI